MLEKIVEAAKSERVEFSVHALAQAAQRKITTQDVTHALIHHRKFIFFPESNKFNLYGEYSDKLFLLIAGVYVDGILIITTHKVSKIRIKL